MKIVYTSPAQRFSESFEIELQKTGIKLLIEELTRRLDALESQKSESQEIPVVGIPQPILVATKRKRGRKPGFKQPWSEARRAAHRLKKERRLEEIRNNPRAQALISALSGTGSQAGESQKPKVVNVLKNVMKLSEKDLGNSI
jgi:hypothetical protein